MAESKLGQLVALLDQRTREGKVRWERTAEEGVFQTSFPKQTVTIRQLQPRDNDFGVMFGQGPRPKYRLSVLDERGQIIEETDDTTVPRGAQLFPPLFETARRQAMDVDQALDELLHALQNR